MNLPRYEYKIKDNFLDYEFVSSGPKGEIKKVVRFTQMAMDLYNLGFGDFDEETGSINDLSVTNNGDSRKILATVASVVEDFSKKNNSSWIGAKGNTPSRTRLYRMGITNHWMVIKKQFFVFGLKGGTWQAFILQTEYDAFLIPQIICKFEVCHQQRIEKKQQIKNLMVSLTQRSVTTETIHFL